MKKKGFTLIELLAVIVVLAIIALIATPIVMNVIKNAQMGAAERSADNYVKAVETLIATEKLDGNKVEDGSYTITSTGKLTIDGKDYEVEVSGTKPNGGTIVVENGQVVKDSSTVNYKDYTVTFENGVAKAEGGEGKKLMTLADCDYVSGTKAEGEVGAKYTCDLGDGDRTFYVLEAGTSSKPATLILGEVYAHSQAWCDQSGDNPYNNACAADKLKVMLDDIIENAWTKLDRNQIAIPSAAQIVAADGREENE
jgi:type IV pilus assembly protein PilA